MAQVFPTSADSGRVMTQKDIGSAPDVDATTCRLSEARHPGAEVVLYRELSGEILKLNSALAWRFPADFHERNGRAGAGSSGVEEPLARFLAAFEHAPVAMAVADGDGRIQRANERYLAASGLTLDAVKGTKIDVLSDSFHDASARQELRAALESGATWERELAVKTNGHTRWEQIRISPFTDDAGVLSGLVCSREDVSKRKHLEDEVRHAYKLESLGALAAGIAHDFNNVLAAVNGYAELFGQTEDDALRRKCVVEIRRAGGRAAALVRQILSFSRKPNPEWHGLDLNALVEDLVSMMSATFPRTIGWKTTLAAGLPRLRGDTSQLQQVLLNLCVNARDAMASGGTITVRTSKVHGAAILHLGADPARGYVRLSVADTGVGMTPEVRASIFVPFYTTKSEARGTGLGLSVVRAIVADHQGLIDVQSVPGAGSTFDIYFPTTEDEESPALACEQRFPGGNEAILVVDDEPALRDLLATALGGKGYRVMTAASATDAVELIGLPACEFAAVLLDLDLPDGSGLDAGKMIRVACPNTKVIVTAAVITAETRAELERVGHHGLILKPFTLSGLGRRLREVLDGGA